MLAGARGGECEREKEIEIERERESEENCVDICLCYAKSPDTAIFNSMIIKYKSSYPSVCSVLYLMTWSWLEIPHAIFLIKTE